MGGRSVCLWLKFLRCCRSGGKFDRGWSCVWFWQFERLFWSHGNLQSCLCGCLFQIVQAMGLLMHLELGLDSGEVSDLRRLTENRLQCHYGDSIEALMVTQ